MPSVPLSGPSLLLLITFVSPEGGSHFSSHVTYTDFMNQSVMVDLPSLPDTQGRGPSTEELHPPYGPLGMSVVLYVFISS